MKTENDSISFNKNKIRFNPTYLSSLNYWSQILSLTATSYQYLFSKYLIFFKAYWYFFLYFLFYFSSASYLFLYCYKTPSDLMRIWDRGSSCVSTWVVVWFNADLLKWERSNLEPMVEEKLDFFFLWVLIKDCISKVLCMIWELLANYLDLLRCCFSAAEPERFSFLWAI